MKKSLVFCFVVAVVFGITVSAFANGGKEEGENGVKPRELKLAISMPKTHHYYLTAAKFADLVKEKTNGMVTVKIYPNALLGNGKSQVEGVRLGKIDFTIQYTGYMSQFIPDTEIFGMEYAFDTWDQYYEFCYSKYAEGWYKEVEKYGLKVLNFSPNGKYFLVSKKPIHNLGDLKGMKMRGKPGTKQSILFDKIHGTATTPVSYNELYSSLQLGVVDVISQNVSNIKNSSFYEVAPYIFDMPTMFAINPLYMSMKTWDSFSPKVQKIIQDSADVACKWMQKEYPNVIERNDRKFLVDKGVQFYTPTDSEKKEWLSKTDAIWDLYKTSYSDKAPEIVDYILNDIVHK
ncbi:MAG: TRAP transporter substrate-binding protein [Spirochaetales bacterium]|nr:TRAP transporter substrate-binding protein [Spirochaetales bacterium]